MRRIDRDGRRFQRDRQFKVYLTNPPLRCAPFTPVDADHVDIGRLVKTAIYSQWFNAEDYPLYYARWPKGEVDLVVLQGSAVQWAIEVKWSDNMANEGQRLAGVIDFCERNRLSRVVVTTRSLNERRQVRGVTVEFRPSALHCFSVGFNLVKRKTRADD